LYLWDIKQQQNPEAMNFNEHIQQVQNILNNNGVKMVADIAISLANTIEEMEANLATLEGEDHKEQAAHLATTKTQLKACKTVLGHGVTLTSPLAK
jgi:hypothetical protein